ncbi:MAG: YkgJ family cysteine cluster protein [Planctomycetes bacterium]|nr:YkgJ family cysteine cluster protein [Planctomycetota bacterium]
MTMGCVLCEHCTAECCRYIALPIDKPTTKRDFDDIRWYLMHEGIIIFVEDGDWYVQFRTRCKHLQADFRCGIYEKRPAICREYKADGCDYVGGDYGYKHVFTESEQIVAFGRKYLTDQRNGKTRRRSRKRRRAAVLSSRRKTG